MKNLILSFKLKNEIKFILQCKSELKFKSV